MKFKASKLRFLGKLVLPLLIIFFCSIAVCSQVVHLADPNLEMAVREALKNHEGSITADDMARLIELNAAARGITDLFGWSMQSICKVSILGEIESAIFLHLLISLRCEYSILRVT